MTVTETITTKATATPEIIQEKLQPSINHDILNKQEQVNLPSTSDGGDSDSNIVQNLVVDSEPMDIVEEKNDTTTQQPWSRDIRVLTPFGGRDTQMEQISDDFYDVTPEDLKELAAANANKPEPILMTREMREREKQKKEEKI